MALARILWNWLCPAVVLAAALIRANLISTIYFICFLSLQISTASPRWQPLFVILLAVVSGLAVIGQIVFQALVHTLSGTEGVLGRALWTLLNWPKFDNEHILAAVQEFVPDVAVLVLSILSLIANRRHLRGGTTVSCYSEGRFTHYGFAIAILLLTLLSAAAYASLLTSVYFILSVSWVLAIAKNAHFFTIASILRTLAMWYSATHVLLFYLFQLETVYASISETAVLLGLYRYTQFSAQDWPVYIGMIAWLLLFITSAWWRPPDPACGRIRGGSKDHIEHALGSGRSAPAAGLSLPSMVGASLSLHRAHVHHDRNFVVELFMSQGWKLALFVYMLVAMVTVGLLSVPLLAAFLAGALLPTNRVLRWCIPLLIYSLFVMALQYVIAEIRVHDTDVLRSIGFTTPYPVLLAIGLHLVAALLLALVMRAECYRVHYLVEQVADTRHTTKGEKKRKHTHHGPMHRLTKRLARLKNAILASTPVQVIGKTYFLAQQLVLKYCIQASLVGVYACSLQSVNLISAGYMVFFITFILYNDLARRHWKLLKGYTECAILVKYIWQVSWTRSVEGFGTILVGLRHGSNIWRGLEWDLVILMLCIVQGQINEIFSRGYLFSEHSDRHLGRTTIEDLGFPPIIEMMYVFISRVFINYGLAMAYLGLFLIGVLSDYSLITAAYLVLLYMMFIIHMVFRRPKVYVKRLWPILMAFAGAVLLVRYAVQFDQFYTWLEAHYPYSDQITLQEIGLVEYHEGISLFVHLLGNVIALILLVWQWNAFPFSERNVIRSALEETTPLLPLGGPVGRSLNTGEAEVPPDTRGVRFIQFCQRALVLHSAKLTVLCLVAVSIIEFSVLNFVLLLVAVLLILIWRPYVTFGLPTLIYCQLVTLAQLLYQVRGVSKDVAAVRWLGFRMEQQSTIFYIVAGYFFVMLFVMLQHAALHIRHNIVMKKIAAENVGVDPTSPQFLLLVARQEQSYEPCPLFKVDEQQVFRTEQRAVTTNLFLMRLQWYLGNFYSLHGYYLFLGCLLITVFIHSDVVSILYLAVFVLANVTTKTKFITFLQYVIVLFMVVLISDYVFMLGLPPPWRFPWQDNGSFGPGPQNWLNLVPSRWELAGDFLCFFLARLVLKVPRDKFELRPRRSYTSSDLLKSHSKLVEAYMHGHKRSWNEQLKVVLMRLWIQLIPLVMFIIATIQPTVLSGGYVLFSLYFLFRGDTLVRRKTKSWTVARLYNYAVLIIKILFQVFQLFHDTRSTVSLGATAEDIVGLHQITYKNAFTLDGVLIDLLIFLLLAVQQRVFRMPEFVNVLVDQKVEQLVEREKAKLAAQLFEESTFKKYQHIVDEMKQRRARLEKLRHERFGQLHKRVRSDTAAPHAPSGETTITSDDDVETGLSDIEIARLRYLKKKQKLEEEKKHKPTLSSCAKLKRLFLRLVDYLIVMLEHLYNKKSQETLERKLSEMLAEGHSVISVDEFRRFFDEGVFDDNPTPSASTALLASEPSAETSPSKGRAVKTETAQKEQAVEEQQAEEEEEREKEVEELVEGDEAKEDDHEVHGEDHHDHGEHIVHVPIARSALSAALSAAGPSEQRGKEGSPSSPPEDANRVWRLLYGSYKALITHSHLVCYLVMVINHAVNADVLSVVYPASVFMCAALHFPRPYKHYWRTVLGYAGLVLCLKFVFQIGLFCICNTATSSYYLLAWQCATEDAAKPGSCDETVLVKQLTTPYIIGLYPFGKPYLRGAFWDFAVLVVVLWHRYLLIMRGWWHPVQFDLTPGQKLVEEAKAEIDMYRKSIRSGDFRLARSMSTVDTADGSAAAHYSPSDVEEGAADEPYSEDGEEEGDESGEEEHYLDVTTPSRTVQIRRLLANVFFHWPVAYFTELVQSQSPSKDVYLYYFTAQVLGLIMIALLPAEFTATPYIDAYQVFVKSRIPWAYVLFLLVQFFVIVIDRVIYLYRAIRAKLVLQYTVVVVVHVILFFFLPAENVKPFSESYALIFYYLVTCVYFYYSARQISHGFPLNVQGQFLTRSRRPGFLAKTAFTVYRAVPFVFELRTLLDWIVTKTTLDFFQWLKLEDIFAELYLTLCNVVAAEADDRPPGGKQRSSTKCTTGVVLFVALCIVIWLPLLLFGVGSPGIGSGKVLDVEVSIGLQGYVPFYTSDYSVNVSKPLSKHQFEAIQDTFGLLDTQRRDTQLISLPQYSESFWQINPVTLQEMMDMLSSKHYPKLELSYTIVRNGATGNVQLVGSILANMNATVIDSLKMVLNGTSKSCCIPHVYQRQFSVPVQGNVDFPSKNFPVGLAFTLAEVNSSTPTREQYFQVNQTNDNCGLGQRDRELDKVFSGSGPQFITVTDEILMGLASSLATGGVMGLYVSVVLAVGKFLRLYVTGLVVKIPYQDLPNPDAILQHCDDLYMARADGDLLLEEDLYHELIQLYRSTEQLIAKTRKTHEA